MANILIKQGREIAGSSLVTPSSKADKVDLTSIIQTGTVSTQVISYGTYFYLNDILVRARVDIANGATFTLNTNYEVVTAGALNELNEKFNYSTTEHVVGKWIDGKTLYEKTIVFGALPNNTTKTVAHNISNLGYIVGYEAVTCRADKTGHPLPIVVVNSAQDVISQTYLYYTASVVGIICNADRSSYANTWVTLRYTKAS